MRIKHHLSQSLQLQALPSPWPRMVLSCLSVTLPLIVGLARDELRIAIFGALFGFIMILNDHFGPLGPRIIHLITAFIFITTAFFIGMLLSDHQWLLMIVLFTCSFFVAKTKGVGLELERMLLFATLQLLAASQMPEMKHHYAKALSYTCFSLCSYLTSLCIVFLILKHEPNFQKSKRQEFREALGKNESNRFAFTLACMTCLGFWIA